MKHDYKHELDKFNYIVNSEEPIFFPETVSAIRHALTQSEVMQKRIDDLEETVRILRNNILTRDASLDNERKKSKAADELLEPLKFFIEYHSDAGNDGDYLIEVEVNKAKQAIEKFEANQ